MCFIEVISKFYFYPQPFEIHLKTEILSDILFSRYIFDKLTESGEEFTQWVLLGARPYPLYTRGH